MRLETQLAAHGLYLRGITRLTREELAQYDLPADKPALALVGNTGSSYWPEFSQSPEFLDAAPDPLDRWSRRVAEALMDEFDLQPLYPFEGPPYYPFQRWANRAEALEASPIGVLMHPEFGLWHSYRFALLAAHFEVEPTLPVGVSPCLECVEKPCLHTCPVDAFDSAGYAVERCSDYLGQTPDAGCHETGCLARYACPVAPQWRYQPAQGRFHLRAFLDQRGGK